METTKPISMPDQASDGKPIARRARKGSGCVYRPKFKGKNGRERFGEWRIKFIWKDDSGVKHVHDERVQGQETNKSIAQELLKTRMAEAKSRALLTHAEDLTYENLRSDLINNYGEKARKSLLMTKDGRKYISSLNHLDNFFTGRKAIEIRVPQITAFKKARMASGVGNSSVNRSLGLLRRMFSLAVRDRNFPKDRVPFFELLEEPEPRVGFLKQEEFTKLRHELPENLRPVLALGYYCGMRLGEIRRLKWSGVDLKRGEIMLQGNETKNGKPRAIPLMCELPEMLAIMQAKNPQAEYVFGGDRPLGSFRKTWNSACVRAALGKFEKLAKGRKKYVGFIFHSLRRTALTNMADAGVSAHAAMSISGHLSQKVFNDYLQLVERQAKEAKRKMETYLGGTTNQTNVKEERGTESTRNVN
jgi:integrase